MKKIAMVLVTIALISSVYVLSINNKTVSYQIDKIEYKDPNTQTGTLEIDNIQVDKTSQKYTYTVKIDKLSGAVKYTINGTENYKVFNARGEANFEISSNDKLVIYEVPIGVSYSVTQSSISTYKTTINNNETNTSAGTTGAATIIKFNNDKKDATANENPKTEDNIWIYGLFLIAMGAIIFAITRIKTPKYTTE